eukprot:TRINITY_DN80125_c0_g1_i1.p1 TRINITY_DN80125_c0_g1~~TRINITY_DN80125_c0_g1_i1.p1  ORF type:complete len:1507 (-),score=236.24 TRINITY_DN80125_c0_g1_i1:9-4529(-)
MMRKVALTDDQKRKIQDCLDVLQTVRNLPTPSGTTGTFAPPAQWESSWLSALQRLEDFVEGDNCLLLTIGRQFSAVPILASALLNVPIPIPHSADTMRQMLVRLLRLLDLLTMVAKKKQNSLLCDQAYLTQLLALLDSTPEISEKACGVLSHLLPVEDSVRDRLWNLCVRRTQGSTQGKAVVEDIAKVNALAAALGRGLASVAHIIGERMACTQHVGLQMGLTGSPPLRTPFSTSTSASSETHELQAHTRMVDRLCSLLVECVATSKRKESISAFKQGIVTIILSFLYRVFATGGAPGTLAQLEEHHLLLPLFERLCITAGAMAKDNPHVHAALALDTDQGRPLSELVVDTLNAMLPECMERVVAHNSPGSFATLAPLGVSAVQSKASKRSRPSTVLLRVYWKKALYSLLFLAASLAYGNEEVKNLFALRCNDAVRRFVNPRLHKWFKSLTNCVVILKKRHYDVDAVTKALKRVDKFFGVTRVITLLPRTGSAKTTVTSSTEQSSRQSSAGSTHSGGTNRALSAQHRASRCVAHVRATSSAAPQEPEEDDSEEDEDDFDVEDAGELPEEEVFQPPEETTGNTGSRASSAGSTSGTPGIAVPRAGPAVLAVHFLLKYLFFNMHRAFDLVLNALSNIDEDIIFHASTVMYKLLYPNPAAQRRFIECNGVDIVNQLLRDYDLDIQLIGIAMLRALLLSRSVEPISLLNLPQSYALPTLSSEETAEAIAEAEEHQGQASLRVKVYDSLRETAVPTYLLSIVADFPEQFRESAPQSRAPDDLSVPKEVSVASSALHVVEVIAKFAPFMRDFLRELDALPCIITFLSYASCTLRELYQFALGDGSAPPCSLPPSSILSVVETACITAASLMKRNPANQNCFRALHGLAPLLQLLDAMLLPPEDTVQQARGKLAISGWGVTPQHIVAVVQAMVVAVEGNASTQHELRQEKTRSIIQALLANEHRIVTHNGLLLLSHLVCCSSENQAFFFTPLVASHIYALLAHAQCFLRQVAAAPAPLPSLLRPTDDDEVQHVEWTGNARRGTFRGNFLDLYSQYYQQVLYGLLTLTNFSHQNQDIQDAVGKRWIFVEHAEGAPSDTTPTAVFSLVVFFLQMLDPNVQSAALACINSLTLHNEENAAKLVCLGLLEAILALLPAVPPPTNDTASVYSGATSVTSTSSVFSVEEECPPAQQEDGEEDDEQDEQGDDGETEEDLHGKVNNQVFLALINLDKFSCAYLAYILNADLLPQLSWRHYGQQLEILPPIAFSSPLPGNSRFAALFPRGAVVRTTHATIYEQLMLILPLMNGLAYMNLACRGYLLEYGVLEMVLHTLLARVDADAPGVCESNHPVRLACLYLLSNLLAPATSGVSNTALLLQVVQQGKLFHVFSAMLQDMPDRGFKRAAKHQKLLMFEILAMILQPERNRCALIQDAPRGLLDAVLRDSTSVSLRLSLASSDVLLLLLREDESLKALLLRPHVVETLSRLQALPHVNRNPRSRTVIQHALGAARELLDTAP